MRELLLLGFDFRIPKDDVALIASADVKSKTMSKILEEAKQSNRLIDCTRGKGRRSIVISKSGFVYLSHVTPVALHRRFEAVKVE